MVDGAPLLDLDYSEDSTAEVDANVVMTGEGGLLEVQATAERTPLSRAHLDELLALAGPGHRAAEGGSGAGDSGPLKLLLATHNEHKRREFARLLDARRRSRGSGQAPLGCIARGGACRRRMATCSRERARQGPRGGAGDGSREHRRRFGDRAAALGGAPGVRSARYAGEHAGDEENLAEAAAGGPRGERASSTSARSRTSIPRRVSSACSKGAAPEPSRRSRAASGGSAMTRRSCPSTAPRASRWPSSQTREKDAISHRGRAAAGDARAPARGD